MSTRELLTDVAVIGGGTGGTAAALAALRLGKRVILTEETDWLGGQLTSQAVPPDEPRWIEGAGCTRSYRRFRDLVRQYYRDHYPLLSESRQHPRLNPGRGHVSRLCHEPRVALAVLEAMLAPYRAARQLTVVTRHKPTRVETDGDRVAAVHLESLDSGNRLIVHAPYALDATELGDLLELGNVEHVIGSESQSQTGEPHAKEGDPDPLDQQAVTWCFAMSHHEGEDHTIEPPAQYDFWRDYQAPFWPGKHLGWTQLHPISLQPYWKAVLGD
ncbi:MAG TPA: FAD-dependent oxidoreductase, partial [Deinococcales bacterium]|nr:FAD-dependent oxidoreductase [Deinococcales bacterium]